MTSRIQKALQNCQDKEAVIHRTAAEKEKDKPVFASLAIGMVGIGVFSYMATAPALQKQMEMASTFHTKLMETYPNAGVYGLGALAVGALALYGVHRLEKRDQQLAGATLSSKAADDISRSTRSVMKVNESLGHNTAIFKSSPQDTFTRTDEKAVSVLKKNGFDPSNKAQMLKIQQAYNYGVSMASLDEARQVQQLMDMKPDERESFVNRKIVEHMVNHFEKGVEDRNFIDTLKDKVSTAFGKESFNPHAVARASVRVASQVQEKAHDRKGREFDYGM